MYAATAVGLMMAGAVMAPQPSSAAVATSSQPSRGLLSKDDRNEGDEGDEGDEGAVIDIHSETDDDGSTVFCISHTSTQAFSAMESAHAAVIAQIFNDFCLADADTTATSVAMAASGAAIAFARAIASSQVACISTGMAFGCASATAMAEAWAAATAEAHATAVAESAQECACLADSPELSVGTSSTFIVLSADAFARAEVTACAGNSSASFAHAYAECAALAYATIWTKAIAEVFLEAECFTDDVRRGILAETGGSFTTIEGCERDEFTFGDAFATTNGSTAEGVRACPHLATKL